MKLDISLWDNTRRLRERVKNLAQMILSITAVNGFYLASQKSWILLVINVLFFLTTLPVFMSYSKWSKEPPKTEEIKEEIKNEKE